MFGLAAASGSALRASGGLGRPAWRPGDPADETLGVGGDQYGCRHRDDHGDGEGGEPGRHQARCESEPDNRLNQRHRQRYHDGQDRGDQQRCIPGVNAPGRSPGFSRIGPVHEFRCPRLAMPADFGGLPHLPESFPWRIRRQIAAPSPVHATIPLRQRWRCLSRHRRALYEQGIDPGGLRTRPWRRRSPGRAGCSFPASRWCRPTGGPTQEAYVPFHLPKEAFKRHTIDELWRIKTATSARSIATIAAGVWGA